MHCTGGNSCGLTWDHHVHAAALLEDGRCTRLRDAENTHTHTHTHTHNPFSQLYRTRVAEAYRTHESGVSTHNTVTEPNGPRQRSERSRMHSRAESSPSQRNLYWSGHFMVNFPRNTMDGHFPSLISNTESDFRIRARQTSLGVSPPLF